MAAYRMTPRRRAALRKAQLVSARKRKGKGRGSRKQYVAARKSARKSKNLQLARHRGKPGYGPKRRAEIRKYHGAIDTAHRARGRGSKNIKARRIGRKTARGAGKTLAVSAIVMPGGTAMLLGSGITAAHAGGKGFTKGLKKGYSTRRARDAAARRNLARHDFSRATAHRIPQRSIAAPSRATRGRRVRGY